MGLRFGASVLMVFALLYYIAGAIALIAAIYALLEGVAARQVGIGMLGSFVYVIGALSLAMVGGLLHASSAACLALRDIARNSFR